MWDSRDLGGCLPVVCPDPQGDAVGAAAQALLVCRRGRQQAVQHTRRVPERGACAQLGLHPLQLRRAPRRQQRANRRDRPRLHHGRRLAAAAHLEPGRLELDRAEQRLQPARAPVLERLQCPACRADPVISRMLRHRTAQHARLQPGQQRLACGEQEAGLRKRAAPPPGRLNVTSSVVVTSPALVRAPSRTVHRITPAALVVRHQADRSARQGQAGCPRFLTLPK